MEISQRSSSLPWISGRRRSFGFAIRGLRRLYRETNARIHACASVCAIAAALMLGLSPLEWALIALAMTAVWVGEALNTALELLADAVVPERHPLVGAAKDVAAGGVLLAAIGAVCVGAAVFLPRLLAVLG
jgi:diacylglycerol kinase (ATP)